MSALFSPIKLRGLTLKNRVVVSPMCQYSAEDGVPTDWHFTHINNLSLSGAAMFCIEATHVEAIGRITPGCLGLYSDAAEAALKQILASVRKHSSTAVAMQLAHAGRKASSARPWDGGQLIPVSEGGWQTVAPSALPHKEGEAAPLALDAAGLTRIREAFVEAAKRAERIGIDAIELHGAHGYLMHQFLSPLSNKRNDAYGGDFDGRTRFPLEVAEAVRAAWPKDKPVFLRVSAVDGLDGGWTMDDTVAYARELALRGIDVIDCSSGGLYGSATAARVKRSWGFQVPYAERVRREAGIMSMAVGLIIDPHFAESILQKGQADLIAIAREALVNPCWPQMAEITLGRKAFDAMDDWPVQYGWWLKHRERSIAQIRADEAAAQRS